MLILKELRPLFSAVAVVLFGTVMHQTLIAGFPFGMAFATVLILGLGIPLRQKRRWAWLFALLVGIGIFISGLETNQDAMIPANTLGYLWAFGSIGLAFLIAMWPKFKTR